jgi:four helix bundle protein
MITSYKELSVWQTADELAFKVFDLTDKYPRQYMYDLTNQLRRAVLSVPTNIAEGCASFHTKEFLQFLNVARRSLSETKYLIDFSHRRGLIGDDERTGIDALADSVGKQINALVRSLRSKESSKH